ncbi:MAG: FAD-dependent oxidoreductase [Candidatus Omnitrophica bacterium]|nr:FAD-dependent oxidoreductase [Candidatus Omnitrophota bacterium]
MKDQYEVIVAGGGTAGIIAALQAARAGASTLVVEKQGILGGTMVTAGISYPSSFHAYGKQIIAGIGWELCLQTKRETGEDLPEINPQSPRSGLSVNPAVFAALADEKLLEAGAEILFHAMPAGVCREDNFWKLTLATKTGLQEVKGKILVDCTGDANLVSLAGFPVRINPELQAATLVVQVSGYEAEKLDYQAIQAAFEKEVASGRMRWEDPGWSRGKFEFFLRHYGGNRIHLPGINARTSEGKSIAEIEGRKAMLRILRFCRKQPGLESFRIDWCAPECGIRETATIVGKKFITLADYETGRVWEDAVCYSCYAVDIHRSDHTVFRNFPPGVYPTIPLGAMLPAGSTRLIVAGRCISGDWEASSSYRVEASCMAIGQAAGAAAALAAQAGKEIEEVPIEKIRELLRKHGAIVPGDI